MKIRLDCATDEVHDALAALGAAFEVTETIHLQRPGWLHRLRGRRSYVYLDVEPRTTEIRPVVASQVLDFFGYPGRAAKQLARDLLLIIDSIERRNQGQPLAYAEYAAAVALAKTERGVAVLQAIAYGESAVPR